MLTSTFVQYSTVHPERNYKEKRVIQMLCLHCSANVRKRLVTLKGCLIRANFVKAYENCQP